MTENNFKTIILCICTKIKKWVIYNSHTCENNKLTDKKKLLYEGVRQTYARQMLV